MLDGLSAQSGRLGARSKRSCITSNTCSCCHRTMRRYGPVVHCALIGHLGQAERSSPSTYRVMGYSHRDNDVRIGRTRYVFTQPRRIAAGSATVSSGAILTLATTKLFGLQHSLSLALRRADDASIVHRRTSPASHGENVC